MIPQTRHSFTHHLGAACCDVTHLARATITASRGIKRCGNRNQPARETIFDCARQGYIVEFLFEGFEERREFFVLMFITAVGLVTVCDKECVTLVAEAILD